LCYNVIVIAGMQYMTEAGPQREKRTDVVIFGYLEASRQEKDLPDALCTLGIQEKNVYVELCALRTLERATHARPAPC
jgi:hypothetical protein